MVKYHWLLLNGRMTWFLVQFGLYEVGSAGKSFHPNFQFMIICSCGIHEPVPMIGLLCA